MFVNDQGGNENFNLYAVNPNEQPPSRAEVPVARNLTNSEKLRTADYNVPRTEPDAVYVGMNDCDPAWHDLYKLKISTGERTLLRQNTERVTNWIFDNKDQLRLATRSTKSGDKEVLRVDADGKFTKIYSCSLFETCSRFTSTKTIGASIWTLSGISHAGSSQTLARDNG